MEQYQLKQKKSETDRASQQHIAEVISYVAFVFQVLNFCLYENWHNGYENYFLAKKHEDHGYKVLVVCAPDTVIDPFAVVVEITSTSVTVETMFSCLFYIKQAVLAEKRGDLSLYLQGRYCNLVLLMPLLL